MYHKKDYSFEIKQIVVEDLWISKLSFREASKKYNIGHSTIARWEKIYSKEGIEGLYKEKQGGKKQVKVNDDSPENSKSNMEVDLVVENERLRMENDYLKKLNALIQKKGLSVKEIKHK